jgi:dsRNA-specific ribonuclease
LSFEIVSESAKVQDLVVDYVMHHPGATGKMRSKVWKLRRIKLEAKQRMPLEAKISLVDRTIRKHHPGQYRIDLRIGGTDIALGAFDVVVANVAKVAKVAKARSSKAKEALA